MSPQAQVALPVAHTTENGASRAFEHSITWEDDIWRADPVDVELVHAKARRKFQTLVDLVAGDAGRQAQARIQLFHGQSGAGKTHLIRALRTSAHRAGAAYFGYAQMTPDVTNYADYFLRRLINSLEKPYDPDIGGETALQRLTNRLVGDETVLRPEALVELREANLDDQQLADLILRLADDVVMSPKLAGQELDINIVRALLYLQRSDPRIDQRVRQYLYGRELTELARPAVAALDPNRGEGRAFDIIEGLGRLMWIVDGAVLVYVIDQVEDLRFFEDFQDRFQKAVRDLIQIANRLPTSIVLISCLGDFYDKVRQVLAQSYIDRIEKSGPEPLNETRTAEEARLIISRRLQHQVTLGAYSGTTDPTRVFGADFFNDLAGLSTRRLLELAQARCREMVGKMAEAQPENEAPPSFMNALVAALGGSLFVSDAPQPAVAQSAGPQADYRERWERFSADASPEISSDDQELLNILSAALLLGREEWDGAIDIQITPLALGEDVPAVDMQLKHRSGFTTEARVFLCNRKMQGGAFKRQLDSALTHMGTKSCFMLRASEFPPIASKKNQASLSFRKFRESGGRALLVPNADWERMMSVREFHAHHKADPGFGGWFEQAKLLSGIACIVQLLRLDLFNRNITKVDGAAKAALAAVVEAAGQAFAHGHPARDGDVVALDGVSRVQPLPLVPREDAVMAGENAASTIADMPPEEDLPLSAILDEDGEDQGSILAGRVSRTGKSVTLNKSVLKRHTAVLGGSGSGKTTLALCIIEQLLLKGIPAILLDRKGDLCSYANPDVWRALDSDISDRRGEREKLADSIDVAVYTPGRSSGRPISITLLPNGIRELPEHEQQLLANLSSAALGDMLHLKNSATHQKQSGTLSVALKLLGQRSATQVMLADLIQLLEEDDPELAEATQRMDPSGKLRRDLVAQLDSLRHRNSSLFEGGGETLSMEQLLGIGPYRRIDGRTRLSIIYTGFLGDNENILFWVAQFLSEALRFCQRNPNDELQAVVMFDEADLYIPATAKPATAEPLQSLLKRARSAGLGMMLATQSPGDLDYKSRDQITSWFIGRVREDTALRKLKAAFQSESGLDPAAVLPHQTVGEFHLVQEGLVRAIKAHRSLINAEQVPFDRIEHLARETKGQDEKQLRLFS
jgi:hypothetical protein